jgi:hypothetical protein
LARFAGFVNFELSDSSVGLLEGTSFVIILFTEILAIVRAVICLLLILFWLDLVI